MRGGRKTKRGRKNGRIDREEITPTGTHRMEGMFGHEENSLSRGREEDRVQDKTGGVGEREERKMGSTRKTNREEERSMEDQERERIISRELRERRECGSRQD